MAWSVRIHCHIGHTYATTAGRAAPSGRKLSDSNGRDDAVYGDDGRAGVPSRLANLDSSMDVDLVYATGPSESLGYHSSRNGERVTFHMRLDESPPPPPPFGGVDSSALAQEEAEITAVAWGVDSRFMVMLAMLLGVVLGGVLCVLCAQASRGS